jgi:hypothetical protein
MIFRSCGRLRVEIVARMGAGQGGGTAGDAVSGLVRAQRDPDTYAVANLRSALAGPARPIRHLSISSQLSPARGATLTRVAKSGAGGLTLGVPVPACGRA